MLETELGANRQNGKPKTEWKQEVETIFNN